MGVNDYIPSRAQISRTSIQRLHIAMRHLFIRGNYKPLGMSGEAMISSLMALQPEIYGSMKDSEKVELRGLLYIFQRLPIGIESCRYIKLITKEGYEDSKFEPIIPEKRRRNCYRIDNEEMLIEMTRGRSDIYDVLTHLTFMYIEAEKIRRNSLDSKGRKKRAWLMLESFVQRIESGEEVNEEIGFSYLSSILSRTYDDTATTYKRFKSADGVNSLFEITYWLGRLSMEEYLEDIDREITFSSALREKLGHHIYGENWANQIKDYLHDHDLFDKDIHIISSNLHSVMNVLYAHQAINKNGSYEHITDIAEMLSLPDNSLSREKVEKYAFANGMKILHDNNGTNISVQIIDCSSIDRSIANPDLAYTDYFDDCVLIVMDYAFGEQAYESMDELLKPYEKDGVRKNMNVKSINIMGKAGILEGRKGDIMIPTAHIFEGSADNYPVDNKLTKEMFEGNGLNVYRGSMVTVLGTSLQNRDILRYFTKSSWQAIGLEMEGAHYQKAIQAASRIRGSIDTDVVVRYAYYASDNPLETGSTLASGSLGLEGVKPTYLITSTILSEIFNQ